VVLVSEPNSNISSMDRKGRLKNMADTMQHADTKIVGKWVPISLLAGITFA
jgi:hypothetical protein